jgi:hypothetical protein
MSGRSSLQRARLVALAIGEVLGRHSPDYPYFGRAAEADWRSSACAAQIAHQTFSGVAGMSMWVMPNCAR